MKLTFTIYPYQRPCGRGSDFSSWATRQNAKNSTPILLFLPRQPPDLRFGWPARIYLESYKSVMPCRSPSSAWQPLSARIQRALGLPPQLAPENLLKHLQAATLTMTVRHMTHSDFTCPPSWSSAGGGNGRPLWQGPQPDVPLHYSKVVVHRETSLFSKFVCFCLSVQSSVASLWSFSPERSF